MEPPGDVVSIVPPGRPVYGMQLPVQSQSTVYTAEWETRAGPAEIERVARAAEAAGYFYLGVCDHTAIPRRLAAAMGTVWYDTVATLGWLAGITERVRLLSHVLVVGERHPLRAAKELCTLDRLSGGRLVVGVGAGHVVEEYELLAGEGTFERRGRDTDEAVAALALALTEEFPDLPGPRWPAGGLGVAPRPVQVPRPPIWVGGSSRPAIRRAAALGDGWLPQGTRRRARSPSCGAGGRPCGAGPRSTWAPSPSPSTWWAAVRPATRGGSCPRTCCGAGPRRWLGHCGSWWPWACTTSRCGGWPGRWRSIASRCRPSGSWWGRCWTGDGRCRPSASWWGRCWTGDGAG